MKKQLLEINRNFYDAFASSFSVTRDRVQAGVDRITDDMGQRSSILDIGCGNGTLARALVANGFSGGYLGVDMSQKLLNNAEELLGKPSEGDFRFHLVDLAGAKWAASIPAESFDWLVCFAVLHHLPGDDFRKQTVRAFADLLTIDGKVAVSVWQWQNSPRLRKRILPWSTAGLNPKDLDEGDVLLDWRASATVGLRYVHTFDEGGLTALAESAGFQVSETFYSDGKSGNLALYQIWQKLKK